ncbi:MAG TPA: glycoside hydrolase family 44 protein [Pirellulales bacterium]
MNLRCFGLFVLVGLLPVAAARAQVTFTINSSQQTKPISPYIYGTNDNSAITGATSMRLGGNRWTAYNWENNASNAGSDYQFQNDNYLVQSQSAANQNKPGQAVLPTMQADAAAGRATLLTIPMAGYVAADKNGGGDIRNTPNYQQTRLKQIVNFKGSALSLTPDTSDGFVYTNEYVNWIEHQHAALPQQPIFYDLDNEPDLWSSTHAEVHPQTTTYAELIQKSTDTAKAIKSVVPNALVFGGVNYGWGGYVNLQNAPDPSSDSTIATKTLLNFQADFLKQMKVADQAAGHRLVDVLDMHWYPEAQGTNGVRIINNETSDATVAARVQAPRSLWDPTYVEKSWITSDSLPYQPSGTPMPFNTNAIQLLPREQSLINQYDPGMKLAISEYNYGAGGHISGGVAEADALGIFGQQGVFAANWWPDGSTATFTNSAFNMYLNYDTRGGKFGNTSIAAGTDSISTSAVYASEDAGNANRMVLVLINRATTASTATLNIASTSVLNLADAYQLAGTSATIAHVMLNPAAPQWQFMGNNSLTYNMPGMSVTTLVLVKAQLGDFNLDGLVNNADLQAMLYAVNQTATYEAQHNLTGANLLSLGDFNGDHVVNATDINLMQQYLATGVLLAHSESVPEPTGLALIMFGSALAFRCVPRQSRFCRLPRHPRR